ncbi:hypothetical protein JZO67_000964 [Enterococcus sp. 665A]|uniref:Uncharacterized protein n=1 Tax=Candidatus Enterococcus ferrettii TaxID=2815324 RepID=A0ABV0EM39_9ENTE
MNIADEITNYFLKVFISICSDVTIAIKRSLGVLLLERVSKEEK